MKTEFCISRRKIVFVKKLKYYLNPLGSDDNTLPSIFNALFEFIQSKVGSGAVGKKCVFLVI